MLLGWGKDAFTKQKKSSKLKLKEYQVTFTGNVATFGKHNFNETHLLECLESCLKYYDISLGDTSLNIEELKD